MASVFCVFELPHEGEVSRNGIGAGHVGRAAVFMLKQRLQEPFVEVARAEGMAAGHRARFTGSLTADRASEVCREVIHEGL